MENRIYTKLDIILILDKAIKEKEEARRRYEELNPDDKETSRIHTAGVDAIRSLYNKF